METLNSIKQRFGIIGNDAKLNMVIEKVIQIAPTDISVIVTGESGVGKEFIPKIIHNLSHRKHKSYIAVNCGAIPEGTIDSEFFGHEKGAFTGADKQRKGYFEVADGGTIFLDEVGELPLSTQVRLLRVLESGEFIKVGSSNIQKTNIRIIAATNVNLLDFIEKGKFREDLYYRLNTVQVDIPPLRERREDIPLIFRKFAVDFSEKYRIPPVRLSKESEQYLKKYYWPGNIRQLRNLVEQLTVVEISREINPLQLKNYIDVNYNSPSLKIKNVSDSDFSSEREILYKILFDMKKDLNDLKTLTLNIINETSSKLNNDQQELFNKVYKDYSKPDISSEQLLDYDKKPIIEMPVSTEITEISGDEIVEYEDLTSDQEEVFSLLKKEEEFIKKALEKYNGKRKLAAKELGISERTLYRKIKQYGLE